MDCTITSSFNNVHFFQKYVLAYEKLDPVDKPVPTFQYQILSELQFERVIFRFFFFYSFDISVVKQDIFLCLFPKMFIEANTYVSCVPIFWYLTNIISIINNKLFFDILEFFSNLKKKLPKMTKNEKHHFFQYFLWVTRDLIFTPNQINFI